MSDHPPPTAEAARPPDGPTPDGRARRGRHWLAITLLALAGLLLVLAATVVGIGSWAWNSSAAQQRLLRQVPGLTLEAPQGLLNGGAFSAQRLRWEDAALVVEVDDLRWADAQWRWRPHAGAWLGLVLAQPQAGAVRITRKPAPPQPAAPLQPPGDLALPLEAVLQGLRIGSLDLDGTSIFTALEADLHVGAQAGAQHRIDRLQLTHAPVQLSASASIGTHGDLPLNASAEAHTPPGTPDAWRAALQLQGPLQRLDLNATLRTEAGAGLSATATAAPFADWPLAALALQTQDLDLSVLGAGLPQTLLSGRATLADVSAGQPLQLQLALDNAVPGPWNAGRLPLRSVRGQLQGQPSERDRLAFDGLVLDLGDRAGGRVTGSGRWQAALLELALDLQAVQAAQLDTRAPAAVLDGRLALTLQGLPLPGSAAPAGPQALQGSVQADLRGRLPQPTPRNRRAAAAVSVPPLDLRAEAAFHLPADATMAFDLKRFEATAGSARASATASAQRYAAAAWAVKSEGLLQRFDLAAWWPAATAGSRSNLNGRWRADLQLPASPQPAESLLDTLRGAAELTLQPSTLAGVPLEGRAALTAPGRGLKLDAELQAAANRVQARGGITAGVHDWRAEVQAPALAALAPLLALAPGAQGLLPAAGALQASATANGRWPALRSEGQLQLQGLRTPPLQVSQGRLQWTFNGTALDAPLSLDAELDGVVQAQRRLDRLQARLDGSLRSHRFSLNASSPLRPPAWTDAVVTAAASSAAAPGSSLTLQGQGGWQPASNASTATLGAGEWRGTVSQLRAAPRAEGAEPWLAARDLQAQLRLNAEGQPQLAALAPGRIDLFGGALTWQQARWQAAAASGGTPELALEARLEPMQVAPLLARLQPDMGWRGDLSIGARASVHSAARFDADVVVERGGGDLGLTVAGSARQLGLNELRLALAAHDGRWQLTQAVNGNALGVLSGTQSLTAPPAAPVPPPEAALQGGVQLRVADAAVWAAWLPPGWRLGGELQARAVLGGSVGAPTYQGTVSGDRLLVRNIFEGINLKEGTVRVALNSTEAVIEKIDFQGASGGGVHVEGRAALGSAPALTLKVVADKFRALDRVDRRVSLSGSADVGLQAGKLSVQGRYTVDEGLIDVTAADAPSLDSDIVVVNRPVPAGQPAPVATDGEEAAQTGVLAGADLDVRVGLGEALRLRGRGLDTRLRGQLRIANTAAGALAVRGTVNTVEGTYTAYGQNLAIERGAITFTGEVANPRLDIVALRADIDTRVGVVVSGNAVAPRVRLYSDPEMPELDQITWLLTGRAPQGEGRDQSALLQRAALALLAGDSGATGEGFLQRLGVDQLGVGRSDGGDTVVTIGKQLSKRLSVAYEKGMTAAGGTWQLLYRVAGRTTLRARAGVDNAVDVIWSWRWE